MEQNDDAFKVNTELRRAGVVPSPVLLARVVCPEFTFTAPVAVWHKEQYDQDYGIRDKVGTLVFNFSYQAEQSQEEESLQREGIIFSGTSARKSLRGCLWDFFPLWHKTNEEVAEFARRRGKLGIQHENFTQNWVSEPIDVYREYAEKMRRLLLLAAHIRTGKTTEDEVQAVDYLFFPRTYRDAPSSDDVMSPPQRLLCDAINALLEEAGIKPTLTFERGSAELALDGSHSKSLLAALVLELVGAVSAGVYLCSECGNLFKHERDGEKRKPRTDRGAYCGDNCSEKATQRQKAEAAARSRERKKDEDKSA